MSGPPPINVAGLRKVFRQTTTGQSVIAIERLDLTIAPREVVAIVGQTGCGKSTFFDLMIGLEAPTEGAIRIGDKSPHTDFDLFRGRIATVFQQDRLLPWRSALDNAKLPLELIGLPEDELRQRALTWLKRLGLEHFANAYPHELSGGMRQRVAIARAFVVQPDILLAHEAFGQLSFDHQTCSGIEAVCYGEVGSGLITNIARVPEPSAILFHRQRPKKEGGLLLGEGIVRLFAQPLGNPDIFRFDRRFGEIEQVAQRVSF